jgi:hypothetical protein
VTLQSWGPIARECLRLSRGPRRSLFSSYRQNRNPNQPSNACPLPFFTFRKCPSPFFSSQGEGIGASLNPNLSFSYGCKPSKGSELEMLFRRWSGNLGGLYYRKVWGALGEACYRASAAPVPLEPPRKPNGQLPVPSAFRGPARGGDRRVFESLLSPLAGGTSQDTEERVWLMLREA